MRPLGQGVGTSFTSLTFLFSILQALCEVVEQPAGFFFSDKMTSLDLLDMYFVILDIFEKIAGQNST